MKKRIAAILMAAVMGVSVLAGCTPKEQAPAEEPAQESEQTQEGETSEQSALKISMVTDVGGVKDQSFNQSAWEGLEKVKADMGIEVGYIESKQDADYDPNLESLVDAKNDLIWGVGFKMASSIKNAAEAYPDQKFAIVDNDYGDETPANVLGVMFKEQEVSYLMGVIAAKMTKTNKIGFIGGMDVPVINRFRYGFVRGVEDTNPDAQIDVQFAEAFDNPTKGKAIANQMYSTGIDVIFHAAGDTGTGAIESAKEQNQMVIGVDRDQNDLAPDNVISSAVKRVDNAIYEVAKELKDGNFAGGTTRTFGLAEGGVSIAPTTSKNVPEEILTLVKEMEEKIISGEIKVPATAEEYDAMKN